MSSPVKDVTCIRIGNRITRAITVIGGGYEYSVSYLINGELMVDTGFPWARRSLHGALKQLGINTQKISVVNTHHHEDHIGNNDLLAELGAAVFAHSFAVPEIRFPDELPWYRHFMFGPIQSVNVREAPSEFQTANHLFQVIHMPGHCLGHICLFEPRERWLFSGDLYVASDLDSQLRDADGPIWIRSLEKALSLNAKMLFDGHGTVISGEDEVRSVLARKRDFLVSLRNEIWKAAETSATTSEITQRVFGNHDFIDRLSFSDGWLSLITGSDFSRSNLVKSFLRTKMSA